MKIKFKRAKASGFDGFDGFGGTHKSCVRFKRVKLPKGKTGLRCVSFKRRGKKGYHLHPCQDPRLRGRAKVGGKTIRGRSPGLLRTAGGITYCAPRRRRAAKRRG